MKTSQVSLTFVIFVRICHLGIVWNNYCTDASESNRVAYAPAQVKFRFVECGWLSLNFDVK